MKVLALSTNYEPIGVIDWRRAITLLASNKIRILSEYDRYVSSPSTRMKIPSVIVFKNGKFISRKGVRFSRKNVWIRDEGRCQYCNCRVATNNFTIDHVIPKTAGGKTTWNNVVTACESCNQKKADKPLLKCGLKLLKTPIKPNSLPYIQDVEIGYQFSNNIPEDWKFWLGQGE